MTAHERSQCTRRIVRAWGKASAADLAAGRAWYDRAYAAAQGLDPANPERAAGVIAALSPRNAWAQNLAGAAELLLWVDDSDRGLDSRPRVHTRTMQAQAERIAYYAPALDVLKGPKVRAFYRNITGDTDAVTVDVWAVRVAFGQWPPDGWSLTHKRYAEVAQCYRNAAKIVGETPRDVQAATWIAERGAAD